MRTVLGISNTCGTFVEDISFTSSFSSTCEYYIFLTIPKCCCESIHCLRHGIREILVSINCNEASIESVLLTLANAYKYHKAKPGVIKAIKKLYLV